MTQDLGRGCPPLDIPVLETNRLILRGFEAGDAAALSAIHDNPSAARFLGVTDVSLAEAYRTLMLYLGHWAVQGCGKWAVVERSSGAVVGRVGYSNPPYDWPGLELGWTFSAASWGRGYATEAARRALDWGFEALGAQRVVSMIDPQNASSQAVAKRLGQTPWQTFSYRAVPHVLWAITRDDWQARRED